MSWYGRQTISSLLALALAWPLPALAQPEADPTAAPSDAETALADGNAAMAEGDYARAIDKFSQAKQLDPSVDVNEPLAMAHFRLGTRDYGGGQYDSALAHFQDAQSLYPSPKFHYNIGQCYEALDRPQQAVDSYEAYLRAEPQSPDRANIENKIERLKRQIELRAQAGAASAAPPKPIEPAAPPGETDEVSDSPGRPLILAGAVLLPVGAVLAGVGGTVFGLQALDRSDRVADVFEGGNPEGLTYDQTDQLDLEGQQAQTLQVVSFAVGGALALTGAALLAVGLSRRKAARLSAAPALGRGTVGLTLGGRF